MPRPTDPAPPVSVAILAKAPVAGYAKTRLIPRLGPACAARLQGWLLRRTVATAVAAGLGPVSLWCAPGPAHREFLQCRDQAGVSLHRQPAGDIGRRMHAAIARSPTPGGTLVIGTDCPALTPDLLRQAARALDSRDASIVPAEDGGYVLIGMRRPARELFAGIDWSSPRVMAQTRRKLAALGWRWQEFAPLFDVDRAKDFERLVAAFPDAGR